MNEIDIASARGRRWDVILAGSSFASMFFLKTLPAGTSVLVVEKGVEHAHSEIIAGGLPQNDRYSQDNHDTHAKEWVSHTMFGGNSNCWWACVPRFHPADFALASRYGVGTDWPIGYDDLERHYLQAERIMEVAGGGSDHILPRSAPFPYPPHSPSRFDRALRDASPDWFAQPCGRSNGGSRPPCCGNGSCMRCPIDSKFTIGNARDRFARPDLFVLTGHEVRAVRLEAGTATGVLVRGEDGETEIGGDTVALGANATGNVVILERSGYSHPVLGRYLHEQAGVAVIVDTDVDGYLGGTSITGHGYELYDGAHRADHAAVLTEVWNSPPVLRPERGRWLQRMRLKFIAEDLPQARNRVSLGADDRPHYEWFGHHRYSLDALDNAVARLPEMLPMAVEAVTRGALNASEAHIQGTHRMGTDPAETVIDDTLRCHDVRNLFLLGAGAFPSCSPANPTLTLAALSLRAGETL